MAVLGLLARHGPQHGYQLRKLIEAQNIDQFSNVQLGSIYATLKRATGEGVVEARGTERGPGRGPARAVYAITEAGRSELLELISRCLVTVEQPERPVDLALHLSSLLPLEAVVGLLGRRIAALEEYDQTLARLVDGTVHPSPGVRALIRDIGEHFATINRAEVAWTRQVLARARKGGYRVASTTDSA
jgi:DNA-binding PadR family transcriptional regulator